MTFCHLHAHSEHSYLDGYGSAKQHIAKIKSLGQRFASITNHANIDGCLEWQKECDKQGISPVMGAEFYIVPDANIKKKGEKRGHIILLAKNLKGWQEICRLLTKANLDGFYNRPRIGFTDLWNNDLSNVVILTACVASFLNLPGGIELFKEMCFNLNGNEVYLEIMPHDFSDQYEHNKKILEIHNATQIPLIATNDAHYIEEEDWETQELLLAIQRKAKWADKDRFKFSLKGLYLKSAREMQLAFRKHCFSTAQIKEAMANTVKVAKMCADFRIPKQEICLPSPYESHKSDDELLDKLAWDKINKDGLDRNYQNRYRREFELIKSKNFSKYFLIFYDLVQWCKEKGIPTGPGRGSAAGSLLAYLIGITKVDPIKHHLSFARFLQEDRIDLPDIDMDFAKIDRDRVRQYLVDKYGEKYTCGISTDMRLKGKAAIGAVARVFDVPEKELRAFTKSLWIEDGEENALQHALDRTDQQWFVEKYPKVIKFALKMENQVRGSGQHAAALVVSSEDLTQGTKCALVRRNDRIVCNWTMSDSEYVGLMKLDILGLSTLSVLDEASKETKVDLNNIPLDDQKTFDLINSGKTAGIFQISAKPTTELCKEIHVNNFEEISAGVALVRPGPFKSGMTKEYLRRKHGQKWKALHPIYEKITKYTYGILIYQEQVMQVIHEVAGLPESTADRIRKVIGKKRTASEFEPYRVQFVEGCKKMKTFSEKEANSFWKGLLEWAGYGFSRNHSIPYSLIGYQTAWLKANYLQEFVCAALTYADYDSNNPEDLRQQNELLQEIMETGVKVMPPKTGLSDPVKWVIKDKKLYVPFIEIKGTGEKQAVKCAKSKSISKPRLEGFFGKKYAAPQKEKSKIDLILEEILAHDVDKIPGKSVLSKYLTFNIFKG